MTRKAKQQTEVKKNPVGRPSSYKPEYAEQAYKFCLLGADEPRIAQLLDVSVATITNWKRDYPEFLAALKEGKEIADANVGKSLYQRACGYSHPDVEVKVIDGQVVMVDLVKHYPPDTGAAMAWLKNRQPKLWRDRKEVDLSSNDGSMSPKETKINISAKEIKELITQLNDEC